MRNQAIVNRDYLRMRSDKMSVIIWPGLDLSDGRGVSEIRRGFVAGVGG